MKNPALAALFIATSLLMPSVPAREVGPPNPTAPSAQVTFHLIQVPKDTAAALIAKPEIKTKPEAILATIKTLIADGKARVVVNPTLRVEIGTRGYFDGPGHLPDQPDPDPQLEAEVLLTKESVPNIYYVVRHLRRRLINSTILPRGGTQYLGTLDPSPDPATLELVFLHVE